MHSSSWRPPSRPTRAVDTQLEAISFKLANAEDVTVTIVDSGGNTVATLVSDYPAPRYKTFSLRWNGRRGTAHRYGHIVTRRTGAASWCPKPEAGSRLPANIACGLDLRPPRQQVLLPRSFALVKP